MDDVRDLAAPSVAATAFRFAQHSAATTTTAAARAVTAAATPHHISQPTTDSEPFAESRSGRTAAAATAVAAGAGTATRAPLSGAIAPALALAAARGAPPQLSQRRVVAWSVRREVRRDGRAAYHAGQ